MVEASAGRVALMSIHPRYANAILDGTKTVEFRKRPLAADVTHVVIYSTAPDSAVLGFFEVGKQHLLSPIELWDRFSKFGGIDQAAFFEYYSGRPSGVGIDVREAIRLDRSLDLMEDLGVGTAPQSFQYLSAQSMEVVQSAVG